MILDALKSAMRPKRSFDPEKRRTHTADNPVIVLSVGRSGSTLLQKLLNTHDRLLIWGEHEGILNQLMQAYQTVESSEWIDNDTARGAWLLDEPRITEPEHWSAWDGSFSKSKFRSSMRSFLDAIFCEDIPEYVRWGFKEIRYCNWRTLEFMEALYPNVQFLILVRNPADICVSFTTALSGVRAEKSEKNTEILSNIARSRIMPAFQFFGSIVKADKKNVLPIGFESMVQHPLELMGSIEKFLCLDTPFSEQSIRETMNVDLVSERQRTVPELKSELKELASGLLREQVDWFQSQFG